MSKLRTTLSSVLRNINIFSRRGGTTHTLYKVAVNTPCIVLVPNVETKKQYQGTQAKALTLKEYAEYNGENLPILIEKEVLADVIFKQQELLDVSVVNTQSMMGEILNVLSKYKKYVDTDKYCQATEDHLELQRKNNSMFNKTARYGHKILFENETAYRFIPTKRD